MARSKDWLKGRVVLITGSARGIGLATAKAFARQGARIAISDIDEAAAHRAAEEVSAISPARAWRIDVRDRKGFAELIDLIEEDFGPVDVLVNNAGIMPIGPILEESDETSRLQMDINVFGVLNGMHAAAPGMIRRGDGHIVNIASVAGKIGTPWIGVYSATKHAVVGLTEAVRFENQGTGVHFSYVMPALVRTELISGTGVPRYPPPVEPEDVADAVVNAVMTLKVDTFVPRIASLSTILPALLPRRVNEWLGEKFGLTDMFATVDPSARKAYRDRIFGRAKDAIKGKRKKGA